MYGINMLSFLNKSFAARVRTAFSSLRHIQRNSIKTKTSFDLKSRVENDVVLFNFEKSKFFITVNLFSVTQCIFWTYLGLFLVKSFEEASRHAKQHEKSSVKNFLEKRKYGIMLCVITIIFGWSITGATIFYSFRSIRKIILHKGGKNVTVVTYGLPGFDTIKLPLTSISSFEHRVKAKRYIPVKLKGRYFYYLIDIQGEFSDPTLFDFTAGLKRSF